MKRFHINLAVADLQRSVDFYNTFFGTAPTVIKGDYAKWMLDDPRINFSITLSSSSRGVNHIGLQADAMPEMEQIQERLQAAGKTTIAQPEAECCYASSSKIWVTDPDNVSWETFVTHGEITHYGSDGVPEVTETRCCG